MRSPENASPGEGESTGQDLKTVTKLVWYISETEDT